MGRVRADGHGLVPGPRFLWPAGQASRPVWPAWTWTQERRRALVCGTSAVVQLLPVMAVGPSRAARGRGRGAGSRLSPGQGLAVDDDYPSGAPLSVLRGMSLLQGGVVADDSVLLDQSVDGDGPAGSPAAIACHRAILLRSGHPFGRAGIPPAFRWLAVCGAHRAGLPRTPPRP